jgi:hypothetical protein
VNDDRFVQCSCCRTWFTRQQLLTSPVIEPIGMTFDKGQPTWNLFYFNHLEKSCLSTFTVPAEQMDPFLVEPAPGLILFGDDRCEGHCSSVADLSLCTSSCHWAPYRRLLLRMRAARGLV